MNSGKLVLSFFNLRIRRRMAGKSIDLDMQTGLATGDI